MPDGARVLVVEAARARPTLRRKLAMLERSACECHGRRSISGMVAVPGGGQMRRGINKLFFLPLAVTLVLAAFAVGTMLATVLPLPERLTTWWH
jgi:hypothetical protein